MTRYVYIAASLDGYIADKDYGMDWLASLPNPGESDFGYAAFMAGIDASVIGRRTFETVMAFPDWPYDKPVFVMSTTLKELPPSLAGKAELASGNPRRLVEDLEGRGYVNLHVDGGRTIQAFLREDLIDEMIITHVAKLLGEGVLLFGPLAGELDFTHRKTEVLNDRLVKSHYVRAR